MCIGMANGGKQNHTVDDVKMMSKMTDKEIIKALECCISDKCTCNKCWYEDTKHIINEEYELMPNGKHYDEWSCDEWLKKDLFDLINRQQAEIERKTKFIHDLEEGMEEIKPQIKAEAIKECLDRIEAFLCGVCGSVVEDNPNLDRILFGYNTEAVDAFIDNLRKEMVGEQG